MKLYDKYGMELGDLATKSDAYYVKYEDVKTLESALAGAWDETTTKEVENGNERP